MNVKVERLGPPKAKQMLALNTSNRNIRPHYVARLAGAMERGEWVQNGESIKLNGEMLLDGQHRLLAIVESGTTQSMLVVRDLPSVAQATVDIGARRNIADVLRLRGEVDVTTLAACLATVWRYTTHGTMQRTPATVPTIAQLLAFYEKHPEIRDALSVGRSVRDAGLALSISSASAVYHLAAEQDQQEAGTFFARLSSGDMLESSDPIYVLRRFLLRQRTTTLRSERRSGAYLAAITIKAFNAWQRGDHIDTLYWRPGGRAPEAFPQIQVVPAEVPA